MFDKLKTSHKIILFFIIPTIILLIDLYFMLPIIRKTIWKNSLRYKTEVECFVGERACGSLNITKQKFIDDINRLELTPEEVYNRAQKAKKKWNNVCDQNKKMDCEQIFEYFDRIFKYLDEIKSEQNKIN